MNKISKLAKISKNTIIGINNVIHDNVEIHENVILGNNNNIYNNTIIYPNCKIGNNNIILNNNVIGEHPVDSSKFGITKKFNGVEIGDNNYLHINNIIFGGDINQTIIGDYNKLLAENHIGHDTIIKSNVTLYPRCITGGHSILLDYSVMGMYSTIQQRMVIGEYSMIGMNNPASHNIFPFFIYTNGKYSRLNKHKLNECRMNIDNYENQLIELIEHAKKNKFDKVFYERVKNLPIVIQNKINNFIKHLVSNKI